MRWETASASASAATTMLHTTATTPATGSLDEDETVATTPTIQVEQQQQQQQQQKHHKYNGISKQCGASPIPLEMSSSSLSSSLTSACQSSIGEMVVSAEASSTSATAAAASMSACVPSTACGNGSGTTTTATSAAISASSSSSDSTSNITSSHDSTSGGRTMNPSLTTTSDKDGDPEYVMASSVTTATSATTPISQSTEDDDDEKEEDGIEDSCAGGIGSDDEEDNKYNEEDNSNFGSHGEGGGNHNSNNKENDNDDDDDDDDNNNNKNNSNNNNNYHNDNDGGGNDQEVPWKPQATTSTCEFTHVIRDYSKKRDSGCKKAEYSETTIDSFGNRWRLIVYVNGNGRASNHHLSLFLQVADADDLPFGWKKAVSYVLTLEHPSGSSLSYAKRNPDKTFKLCPKAIDWGWSQFITSDRIQQEGFVVDDSLTVRASVTVKSSSVSIDLEDAELYLKCAVEEGNPEAVQICLDQGASVNCQFKDDLYTPLHTACSTNTADEEDDDDDEEEDDDDLRDEDDDVEDDSESDDDYDHDDFNRLDAGIADAGAGLSNHNNNKNNNDTNHLENNLAGVLQGDVVDDVDSNTNQINQASESPKKADRHGRPRRRRRRRHRRGSNHRPLLAASSGSMKVLELLLEKGADGNACNKWRETPLLIAANNGHKAAVEALLMHGADPSLCSEAGWSALTFAAHKGYEDIVELLLQAGAPVNCRVTEDASTPLHKACAGNKLGHLQAVKLLLEHNADVHALNKWRETPLLTAANHGQAGAVEALLDFGADPCKCTDTGWSPLSIAAYKGHDSVVNFLLEEGAPTEEADPTLSALLQAATKGLPDTVDLLLKHGADHTVTTKKGDTALSILVEQNLIDAAADMVTYYNASIPRCSRDRKKVQRARLLVNLKIKQRERDGSGKQGFETLEGDDDDDDESDKEQSASPTDQITSSQNGKKSKKKKKKKKKGSVAELNAKAAEEALLAELEMEDAERQKQELDANKKSAKKRKKKERERQLKKEQEEKRLAEEREKEAAQRKEREAKEAKARIERERLAAIKRKEEEAERKRILERQKVEQAKRDEERRKELEMRKQQQKQQQEEMAKITAEKKEKEKQSLENKQTNKTKAQGTGKVARSSTGRTIQITKAGPLKNAVVPPKNRGWETTSVPPGTQAQTPNKTSAPGISSVPPVPSTFSTPQRETSMPFPTTSASPFGGFGDHLKPPSPGPISFTKSEPLLNGLPSLGKSGNHVEVPSVALFRRNKMSELLQRIAMLRSSSEPLGGMDDATIKKVLYRWIVRAAHENTGVLDCVIPSWVDPEKLTAFFQRQFISESRKPNSNIGSVMMSMEALKEAGTSMAQLCLRLAKEVAEFRTQVEDQLPHDWNDTIIGMKASEMAQNSSVHHASILLDWANRAQVFLPSYVFNKLQERYNGLGGRLLSTIFSTQIRYETQQLVTAETLMDFSLPADTQSILTMKAQVTAEIWSNPMTSASGNLFWGQFEDTDAAFQGRPPFSKDEENDSTLSRFGGSVIVIVPLDSMVASQYMHRMLDLLDRAENNFVPLSFIVFLRSECFLDGKVNPNFSDVCQMEPRLRERGDLVCHANALGAHQHGFFCSKANGLKESSTGSFCLVLQNVSGKNRANISDSLMNEILLSMSLNRGFSQGTTQPSNAGLPLMTEMSFSAPEFVPASSRSTSLLSSGNDLGSNFFNSAPPPAGSLSPQPPQSANNSLLPDFGSSLGTSFPGFGGSSIGSVFGSTAPGTRSSRPARGRLFDLVDDGAEDETADVVSGMLGNLNMEDLFSHQPNRNSNGEVDIEAISLMGIGGPAPAGTAARSSSSSTAAPNTSLQPRRSPFGY